MNKLLFNTVPCIYFFTLFYLKSFQDGNSNKRQHIQTDSHLGHNHEIMRAHFVIVLQHRHTHTHVLDKVRSAQRDFLFFWLVVCCPRKTQRRNSAPGPQLLFLSRAVRCPVGPSLFQFSPCEKKKKKKQTKKRAPHEIVEQSSQLAATLNICLKRSLQQACASSPAKKIPSAHLLFSFFSVFFGDFFMESIPSTVIMLPVTGRGRHRTYKIQWEKLSSVIKKGIFLYT